MLTHINIIISVSLTLKSLGSIYYRIVIGNLYLHTQSQFLKQRKQRSHKKPKQKQKKTQRVGDIFVKTTNAVSTSTVK